MLRGVRRGDIDFMIGALRDPLPIKDVEQEVLFHDGMSVLARPDHPLARAGRLSAGDLAGCAWAVPRTGTPARQQFDEMFETARIPLPESVLECGSILLMRELLHQSDLLGCISEHQARAEVSKGLLARLDIGVDWPGRPIGLTYRTGWVPTRAQGALLDLVRAAAGEIARG